MFAYGLMNSTILQVLLNMLYFYGMCGLLKECLLQRYFSKVLHINLFSRDVLLLVLYNSIYFIAGT